MKKTVLATAIICCVGIMSEAAEFDVVQWRGQSVLRLSGNIDATTARQFNQAIADMQPAAHGVPIMLLDSPGGSVFGALMLSAAMRNSPVHTVIPNDAECASACASVVFVAGKYRTMEPFGSFGQHSCAADGIEDAECNELVSQHAYQNGVSHGSISAFITYVPPDDILWFSRDDIDGWGISYYPGSEASGFEKSEPRVIKMITGNEPPAQEAWRLDFWENGWRAFYRPAGDDERELQINQFCSEELSGILLLGMEIHGEEDAVRSAVESAELRTDEFSLSYDNPYVMQVDPLVSMVVIAIPTENVLTWLQKVDEFQFWINSTVGYNPIAGSGKLSGSRENLIFAANNCVY